jgi:murein hydrolase activator
MRQAGLALGTAALLIALPAVAGDPEQRAIEQELHDTELQLQQTQHDQAASSADLSTLQAEVASLREAMRTAVNDMRRDEVALHTIAARLSDLTERHDLLEQRLDARRKQIGSVLSALIRVTALPPEAAFVKPGDSEDRLRSALLMRGIMPGLQKQASLIDRDIAVIHAAKADIATEQQRLAEAKAELEERYANLAQVAERKNALVAAQQKSVDQTGAIAQRLAKSAVSLRELLGRIDTERAARTATMNIERQRRAMIAVQRGLAVPAPDTPPLRLAGLDGRQGGLIAPITGQVVSRYGEGEGRFREGVAVAAAADMPVLAPADGRVVYAGPFRDYGILLIIEHGGGFHSVLTGLGRSAMVAGQWVLAGEPLGRTAAHGSLYIEIRRNGISVDPLAWFTVDRS